MKLALSHTINTYYMKEIILLEIKIVKRIPVNEIDDIAILRGHNDYNSVTNT